MYCCIAIFILQEQRNKNYCPSNFWSCQNFSLTLQNYYIIGGKITMDIAATLPQSTQIIVTLDDNAMVSDIKKAMKLIRGVVSVKLIKPKVVNKISPALRSQIENAREELRQGTVVSCKSPEEMQQYFDSL
jgi:hypothetical protein